MDYVTSLTKPPGSELLNTDHTNPKKEKEQPPKVIIETTNTIIIDNDKKEGGKQVIIEDKRAVVNLTRELLDDYKLTVNQYLL